MLEEHDREIQRLRRYYDDNRDMLEKVDRREELWVKFLEFEVDRFTFANEYEPYLFVICILVTQAMTVSLRDVYLIS